ncbi:MAG: hypothetical protein PHG67_10690 [Bacteroidales bacterium]|nr:hypothetical protein [Bacteroidales bacterium]
MKYKYAIGFIFAFWFICYTYGQVDNANFIDKTETESFQAVLNVDSVSWNMANAQLFGLVAFDIYCLSYPDSVYSNVYINFYDIPYFYEGKLREDPNTGKLWYKNTYNNERLLVDMSLTVGDTFEVFTNEWSTVEDVYYLDGRKIIQFDLYSNLWKENLLFIEGVGRNIGLWYGDYLNYTSCKYDNDQLVYVNQNTSLFIGCFLDPTNVDESIAKTDEFSIVQLSGSKQLKISGVIAYNQPVRLRISDILGNNSSEYILCNDPEYIDMSHLRNGIYVLLFSSFDQEEILDVKKIYFRE